MRASVFVYGSLKRGFSAHAKIEAFVHAAVPGQVKGTLVSAGKYPAMIPAGEGQGDFVVHGEWLTLEAAALSIMDKWEDYWGPDDPRNGYERVLVSDKDGLRTGWAYVWEDDRGCPPVPSGRWDE